SNSDKVDQTPRDIFIKPGKNAKMNCKHKIDNYNQILWYKQSNKQMQLLGYMFTTTSNPETDVKVKMEGDASKGKNCTLIIERVNQSSSAVYFCAASFHSAGLVVCRRSGRGLRLPVVSIETSIKVI
uniref:Ig-like domain-containing protein n=1 Tax=Labrus bergylta TaxID=56723 RepID=A0A3Q3FZ73_9LABR